MFTDALQVDIWPNSLGILGGSGHTKCLPMNFKSTCDLTTPRFKLKWCDLTTSKYPLNKGAIRVDISWEDWGALRCLPSLHLYLEDNDAAKLNLWEPIEDEAAQPSTSSPAANCTSDDEDNNDHHKTNMRALRRHMTRCRPMTNLIKNQRRSHPLLASVSTSLTNPFYEKEGIPQTNDVFINSFLSRKEYYR